MHVELGDDTETLDTRLGALRAGDIVVPVNEHAVAGFDDLHRCLTNWMLGDILVLEIIRGTTFLKMTVLPTEAVPAGR